MLGDQRPSQETMGRIQFEDGHLHEDWDQVDDEEGKGTRYGEERKQQDVESEDA